MIEDFSSAYYRTVMDVHEYSDGPAIEKGLYDFINRTLYLGIDSPVMMRVGLDAGEAFKVSAESAIPRGVLALPQSYQESKGESNVFVLKPEYVEVIGKHYG